jgi:RHS repeat-associated protein
VSFTDDCDNPQPPPPTIAAPDETPQGKSCGLQNPHYTYDPAGNITHIRDDAQQTIYFKNKRVEPSAEYTYDAVYRLIEATGREHLGQIGGSPIPHAYNDARRAGIWSPGPGKGFHSHDGNAMDRYCECYVYDAVGNIMEMIHRVSCPGAVSWRRTYSCNEPSQLEPGKLSNRLSSTQVGNGTTVPPELYDYDAHGNMLRMPHLQVMQWDLKDQLQMTQRQAVNTEDADGLRHHGERIWYLYDSAGQRVRKVTELAGGQVKDERIYLGGFEIYRKNGANPLVRETLHIMDDKQRIALVETRTQGDEPGVPAQLIRYQFGNHLGSVSLEVDDHAQIISYEEYTPYGSTAYQAVRNQTEAPKRYQYTGKERDAESGLYYHGARYYAPWLARWTSCDPAMLGEEFRWEDNNAYWYVSGRPIVLVDPDGRDERRFYVHLDEPTKPNAPTRPRKPRNPSGSERASYRSEIVRYKKELLEYRKGMKQYSRRFDLYKLETRYGEELRGQGYKELRVADFEDMLSKLGDALKHDTQTPVRILVLTHGKEVRQGNRTVATELNLPSSVLRKDWISSQDLQRIVNILRFQHLDTTTLARVQGSLAEAKALVDVVACNINKQETFAQALANLLGGPGVTVRGPKAKATLWSGAPQGAARLLLHTKGGSAVYGTPKGEKAMYPVQGTAPMQPEMPRPPDVKLPPRREVLIEIPAP